MNPEERAILFLNLSSYTGVEVSSKSLRKTEEHFPHAEIHCLHNLIEGIYKPAEDSLSMSNTFPIRLVRTFPIIVVRTFPTV